MSKSTPIIATVFGIVSVAFASSAMAAHTPSRMVDGNTNHPAYTSPSAKELASRGSIFISPRDRELQRLDDLKRQTSDNAVWNIGPDGLTPTR